MVTVFAMGRTFKLKLVLKLISLIALALIGLYAKTIFRTVRNAKWLTMILIRFLVPCIAWTCIRSRTKSVKTCLMAAWRTMSCWILHVPRITNTLVGCYTISIQAVIAMRTTSVNNKRSLKVRLIRDVFCCTDFCLFYQIHVYKYMSPGRYKFQNDTFQSKWANIGFDILDDILYNKLSLLSFHRPSYLKKIIKALKWFDVDHISPWLHLETLFSYLPLCNSFVYPKSFYRIQYNNIFLHMVPGIFFGPFFYFY